MNDRQAAEELRDQSLEAVSQLSRILLVSQSRCSQDQFDRIKKGVGLAIGQIQSEVLDMIYAQYPDLDELA
jgi:hypothetical protein